MELTDLVEHIARSIAVNADDVRATEDKDEDGYVLIKLEVHPDDKGKIIGRQGRVAQSIRTLLRVAAIKNDTRVGLEII